MKEVAMTMFRSALCGVALALALVAAPAGAAVLTLTPTSGAVSGPEGSTVGWGFSFTNTSLFDFAVFNDSQFIGCCSFVGTYNDFIFSQFVVVAPGGTFSESFNNATMSGIGSFQFAPFLPPGQSLSGQIALDYSLFSEDPNNPNFDPGSFVGAFRAQSPASVTVVVPSIPEPATLFAFGGGLSLLGVMALRTRRRLRRA
jgi:hypothetical protein